jgi:DNA-binding beta-propeller fold protein YncE
LAVALLAGLAGAAGATRFEASAPSGGRLSVHIAPAGRIGPGPLGQSRLLRPQGLSLDHKGRLFIADSGNHRIVVTAAPAADRSCGAFEAEFGRFGGSEGQFLNPVDVASREGFFHYVADAENERVQKFDRFRSFVQIVAARGDFDGEFGVPAGIEIDDEGRLYVADGEEDKVWVIDSFTGEVLIEIGSFGSLPSQFNDPTDVALGPNRSFLVADAGNRRVQVFDRVGNYAASWTIGAQSRPVAVAWDPRGLFFVADPAGGRVVVTDLSGRVAGEIAGGELLTPSGLAFGGNETLYVSDSEAGVVHAYRVAIDAGEGE